MKDYITTTYPPAIMDNDSKVRISIYMPTHRTHPDNRQDAIRFKNIISKLEGMGDYDAEVKRLKELENDQDFWTYNLDSLAILMDEKDMEIYRLVRPVEEHVTAGKRFYLKPLIRNFQSDHLYYALGLSRDSFRLFRGNRYGFREIELKDEDRLLENVLGDEIQKLDYNVGSHGGGDGIYYGHSSKQNEIDIDTQRFFNYTDTFIQENYTKEDKTPLILVTVSEHQGTFREISKNPQLLEQGISKSLESINEEDLKKEVWEILEPIYNERTDSLIRQYHVGINDGSATNTIQATLEAIINNRVKTLVLESDKTVNGKIYVADGSYELGDEGDDILNHLAYLAMEKGSEVIILPKEKMPDHLGVFAILRY